MFVYKQNIKYQKCTIVGDMPRGKQFGFLFTEGVSNKEQLAKTIAHELGHGYFQLKHPFEMGLKQGDLKDNLMDYAGGTTFNKYEWDLMHDPGIVTGLFESDTSAMFKYPPNSNYEKLYPKFTNLVKNIYQRCINMPENKAGYNILDCFMTYANIKQSQAQQVYDILKWGTNSLITIIIDTMSSGVVAFFNGKIDSKIIKVNQQYIQQFEQSNDIETEKGLLLFLVVSLLHESIHWSNYEKQIIEKTQSGEKADAGYTFEECFLGMSINFENNITLYKKIYK